MVCETGTTVAVTDEGEESGRGDCGGWGVFLLG